MSVGTCRNCQETIIQRPLETYYVHTRTAMAQCGIRYATPVNPTADETKDIDQWTRLDLDAFWEGLNGIEPIGAMSEPCRHEWANKAGAGYRENPVEICVKCEVER